MARDHDVGGSTRNDDEVPSSGLSKELGLDGCVSGQDLDVDVHSEGNGKLEFKICKCSSYVSVLKLGLLPNFEKTDTNPGRQFRSCSTNTCPIFSWVDPPMCARAMVIIPGLLRSRNALQSSLNAMESGNRRL
ncbi:hypothetical protein Tco_1113875, partial [Tanacetum coccineum]